MIRERISFLSLFFLSIRYDCSRYDIKILPKIFRAHKKKKKASKRDGVKYNFFSLESAINELNHGIETIFRR